ncbi:O-linked GlcNAc transferase, partial [Brachyspira pilosicoli]|nr:O-linked GlcNAc transferase [Brachyspira pilosicoli]
FIKHEKDNEKKEKYEKLSQKYLKKSADLGYDKALEILKD